eukprot:1107421-Prorocentrum_minimum.AAC.5
MATASSPGDPSPPPPSLPRASTLKPIPIPALTPKWAIQSGRTSRAVQWSVLRKRRGFRGIDLKRWGYGGIDLKRR